MYNVLIWQLGPVHVFCFYRFVALQLNNLNLNLPFTYFTEKKFNTVFFSIFLAEQFIIQILLYYVLYIQSWPPKSER
jgi:hypothetical protein